MATTRNAALELDIERAIARLIYEHETRSDWHMAEPDPGDDEVWLTKARQHRRVSQKALDDDQSR